MALLSIRSLGVAGMDITWASSEKKGLLDLLYAGSFLICKGLLCRRALMRAGEASILTYGWLQRLLCSASLQLRASTLATHH